jgi:surface antigen-like variable number repeat protein
MLSIAVLTVCLLVANASDPACSQSAAERNKFIDEAERNEFTLRRTEFVGLTYTRDHVLRDRMTPIINEGDLFTRDKLVRSLRRLSSLKRTLYPVRLTDVELRLDRSERLVDITICFRERPRQTRTPANKSLDASGGSVNSLPISNCRLLI